MGTQVEQSGAASLSFSTALGILFIALKLTGYVQWSWLWVLSPLWIPLALFVVGTLVMLGILALVAVLGK